MKFRAAVVHLGVLSTISFGAACAAPARTPPPVSSAPAATAPAVQSTTKASASAAAIDRLAAVLTVMHAEADGAAICPKDTRGLDSTAKQLFPMAVAARVRTGLDAIPRPELHAFFTEARLKDCAALCRCGTYADFAGTGGAALEAMRNRFLDEEKANPRDEKAIAGCARADAKRVCGTAIYRGAAAEARKARSGEAK